jgi:hypothetical protein
VVPAPVTKPHGVVNDRSRAAVTNYSFGTVMVQVASASESAAHPECIVDFGVGKTGRTVNGRFEA